MAQLFKYLVIAFIEIILCFQNIMSYHSWFTVHLEFYKFYLQQPSSESYLPSAFSIILNAAHLTLIENKIMKMFF